MKVRNDFVSNSSSSSFILMGENYKGSTHGFLRMLRTCDVKYPEFMIYLTEYSNIIFKNYKSNHMTIINKFKEFLDTFEHKEDVFRLDETFDVWHGKDFIVKQVTENAEFIRDLGAVANYAVTENMKLDWMNGKKYIKSISYDGNEYEGYNAIAEFIDKIINENKFISGTIYNSLTCKDRYVIYEFIKILNDAEFEDFLDTVLTINSYQQTDGYDVSMPPEVYIFEKYNMD